MTWHEAEAYARRRGCVGSFFRRIAFALGAQPLPRKRLVGMELASNWIPLAVLGFLSFSAAVGGQPGFFYPVAIIATVFVIRGVR